MPGIAIVTNIIPGYRKSYYTKLFRKMGDNLHLYCQRKSSVDGIENKADIFEPYVSFVPALVLKGERLGWQVLPYRQLLKYDAVFIYGNPRLLSNIALSFFLKLARVKVIVWGQAHTSGANALLEKIRLAWWRQFDAVFTYNDNEAEHLTQMGFASKPILGMNNGLDQEIIDLEKKCWTDTRLAEWQSIHLDKCSLTILSCARLTTKNRFDLAIQGMKRLKDQGINFSWVIIGDGTEAQRLKHKVEILGIDNVYWKGAIYEEEALAPWFLSADIFLHPSAIGLSLLHAMGYGLPVITHENHRTQMPEFCALENNVTGLTYEENNPRALADAIMELAQAPNKRKKMGEAAVEKVRKFYNTNEMVSRFCQLAALVTDKPQYSDGGNAKAPGTRGAS